MAVVGWILVLRQLIATCLFQFVRLLFTTVQRIHWELNGTAQQLREATDPRHYERSAHVLDIVYGHQFCEATPNKLEQYLYTHCRFENPQYVIDNEHVTLFAITDTSAVFTVARQKAMRLWKTEFNPFIKLAQPVFSSQLIVVPLSVFHRMSETIGDPKNEMVFLTYTGRCGSTLLKQVLEYTGRCVTISDPNSPNVVATKYRKEGDTPEVRQLMRDVIRWECRPYPSMEPQPLAYVLKLTVFSAVALPLFKSLYPNGRFMFMYRDVVKASKSWYRISYTLPSYWLTIKLGQLSKFFTKHGIEYIGFDGQDFDYRFRDDMDFGIFTNVLLMRAYLNVRKVHPDVVGVRYEDLVGNPKQSIRRILEHCRLPTDLAEAAGRGLEIDSQKNTHLDQSIVGNFPEPKLTPESTVWINEMFRENGLPLIGQVCLLDGTITH